MQGIPYMKYLKFILIMIKNAINFLEGLLFAHLVKTSNLVQTLLRTYLSVT